MRDYTKRVEERGGVDGEGDEERVWGLHEERKRGEGEIEREMWSKRAREMERVREICTQREEER
jgi:hypothetical protein